MSTAGARLGAGLVCLVIVMGGCAQGDKSDPTAGRITFGACGDLVRIDDAAIPADRRARLTYECGTLAVPVDRADPTGDRIDLHVVRVRSTPQHDRIGSLVVNFGGPGVSGLDSMAHWPGAVSDDLLARFDLVSFDPRGTGRSAGIRCPGAGKQPRPDVDLSTDAGFAEFAAEDARRVRECADHLGGRAPHFTTEATAQDMDAIRHALGEDRLTFVGYSYGAKLGAEYARAFPDRVRAAVLDGPSDPSLDDLAVLERQIAGFEDSFARYADSCASRPSCAPLGDPRELLAKLVKRAATDPIPARKPGEDRVAYPNEILRGVIGFLYADDGWPYLDAALWEAATNSDSTEFFAIDDQFGSGTDDPNVGEPREAAFVINCNDSAGGLSDEQIKAAKISMGAKYPVFGRWAAFSLLGCRHWQPVRHPLKRPTAPGATPILVIGTAHDPATPYAGAASLAETLDARLLTWDGDGHTAYHQSPCVDRHVDAYLTSLTLPAPGTRCA